MRRTSALLFLTLLLAHYNPSSVEAVEPWEDKWQPYGPRADTLLYKIILAYESRLAAFEAGETDAVGVQPQDVERIRRNRPDAFFMETQSYTEYPLQFNLRRQPFSNPAFRKAFAHMIDREGYVIPEIMKGYGVPLYNLIIPLLGDWVNPDVKAYEFNMQKANALLEGAGFIKGADGRRLDPQTGQPLRTLVLDTLPEATNPVYYGTALHIARQAEKLGIKVEVNAIAAPLHSKKVHQEQDFDMYFVGWAGLGPEPDWVWYFFHSRQDYKGGWNEYGVRNATLDRILDEFYYTLDIQKARKSLHSAQQLLQDIVPWVPVASPIAVTAVSGKLRGIVLSKVPGSQYPAGTSWLSDLNTYEELVPYGGSLRFALGQNVGTLNPGTFLWSHENAAMTYVFDFLTLSDPDNINERIPRLAQKWRVDEVEVKTGVRGTKVSVDLAANATWQDGTPFTAYDVNFTILKAGKDWKLLRYDSETIRNVYKTEVPSQNQIVVYLNGTSWVYWLDILGLRPLPKHIWEGIKDPEADPSKVSHPTRQGLTQLMGTGPFIFKEHVPGSHIALVWNPAYFMRNPEKGLILQFIKKPNQAYIGEPIEFIFKVEDYRKRSVNNASITMNFVRDSPSKELKAIFTENGTYTVVAKDLPESTYTVKIKVEQQIPTGVLSRNLSMTLTVEPTWKRYIWPAFWAGIGAAIFVVVLRLRRRQPSRD